MSLNLEITKGIWGERPAVTVPHPGFYDEVGEERFRELVYMHYELIRVSDIAYLFPINDEDDFEQAKINAADYLIQISGGPDYFNQHRGEPQIVGRHSPFRIDEPARHKWLELYTIILPGLVEEGITEAYVQSFWDYLNIHSMWMVNTPSR